MGRGETRKRAPWVPLMPPTELGGGWVVSQGPVFLGQLRYAPTASQDPRGWPGAASPAQETAFPLLKMNMETVGPGTGEPLLMRTLVARGCV